MGKNSDWSATETSEDEGCMHDDVDRAGEAISDTVNSAIEDVRDTVHDTAKGVADLTDRGERTDQVGDPNENGSGE